MSGGSKEIVDAVSGESLMEHTETIARWVRLSGSDEERAAFDYVDEQLRGMGLETTRHSGAAYVSIPVSAKLTVSGEDLRAITHSMAASTPEGGIEADLIYVPDGDYESADVSGKIALVDGMAMPGKVRAAESAGAVALICANSDEYVHEMIVSPVWGSPTPETKGDLPTIPVISVGARQRERLLELVAEGARANLETVVETGWTNLPTLTAQIDGIREPEKFVLFSGHIDSWHYGAMDNGSANATMLEVMRVLAEGGHAPYRSIRVAFWSGHSHGRYAGSTWYADNFFEDLDENCVLHINVDSVGGRDANVLTEAHAMAECRPLAADVIARQTGVEFTGTRFGRAGDQSFVGHGIPSLFMSLSEQSPDDGDASGGFAELIGGGGRSGGLGWWWHTTEDKVDKIEPELLLRDARIYAEIAHRFVTESVLPLSPQKGAGELVRHLESWQEKAAGRLDLTLAVDRARELAGLCGELERHISECEPGDVVRARSLNSVIQEAESAIVRLNYTAGDRFEHDPALSQPPVPLLAPVEDLTRTTPESDDERELVTLLVRRRNRICHELRRTSQRLHAALESIGPP